MSENQDIYAIIIKSFTDKLSLSEKNELDSWKAESRENMLEFLDFEAIWCESGKLATKSQINIPVALSKTTKKAGIRSRVIIPMWLNVAAILVFALVFTGLFQVAQRSISNQEMTENAIHEVHASYGTQSHLNLPDGTVVHLNSGSVLKYPVSFEDDRIRKVELIGEGYFEVKNQNGKPFVVDLGLLQVEATGTSFNIDAYPNKKSIGVALVEGHVNINQSAGGKNLQVASLEPGQVAQLNKNENRLLLRKETDLEKYYAWTEGKIVFVDDPINVVVEKLSQWYNVDISISNSKLESYRFTGTFVNESIEQILSILSKTSPMEYIVVQSEKSTDNIYNKRKIILQPK